jgi:hypothetical protein
LTYLYGPPVIIAEEFGAITGTELLITDSNSGIFPEDMHTCRVIADCQDAYGWPCYVNVTTG